MLFKLNNRLVHHCISRNSTFLLVFPKIHRILSLKQPSVLGACRCSPIAAVLKTACILQQISILATLWIFLALFDNRNRFLGQNYPQYRSFSAVVQRILGAENCKQFWKPLQSARTAQHLKLLTVLDSESHELSKKPIKELNFD